MENDNTATLAALRDFFLARTGADITAACARLAKDECRQPPDEITETMDGASAEFVFNKLFVGPGALQAPPYASYYLEPEPQLMGPSTLRVRRLYEMAGLVSPLQGHLPCDHLGVELDAALGMQTMAARSGAEEPCALWHYFLNEHLKVWLPAFLDRARRAEAAHPAVDLALERLAAWLGEQTNREEGYHR
jgi:TorA maturation chaperone TorD